MTNKPLSRQVDILVQDLENELLVYDLRINKAYCLNQTSALVFEFSDGAKTVSEISKLMSKKLGILVSEDFVWLALQNLEKENLLENREELTDYLAGLSRREIVKKVGLASMVALPIIASVVAPSAAEAQSASLNPLFSRCTTPGNCTSGNCVSTSFLPVGSFCCPPGNGGTQPGDIGTAIGLECFNSCAQAGIVCCSGSAVPTTCDTGFCASLQQFCCACV
jgi:hypothetical protein